MVLVQLPHKENKTLKGHKAVLLIPTPIPQSYLDGLRAKFPDLTVVSLERAFFAGAVHGGSIPEEVWKDATVLLTGSTLPDVAAVPRLEFVQLMSAGVNHILPKPLFRDTDVTFCTANGVHGPQISEWVIATFLAFQHQIPQYLELQKQATWKKLDDPEDAVGQRVGILGYGSIGRQLARVSKAMGMDVHAYTLHPRDTPESRRDDSYAPPGLGDPDGVYPSKWFSGGSTQAIHEFLGSGLDLLVVALPLTDKTRGIISGPEFAVMRKRKTFVANIARGPVVDTDALIEALEGDVIRGAAVDVTEPEPLPDGHRLWGAKNLIVTPHISGRSTSYDKRVLAILEYNLTRLSEGKELTNQVNRKEGY